MAKSPIIMRHGAFRDPQMTIHRVSSAAVPKADNVIAGDGDTLASITQRAYGANTPELQERIKRANGSLTGSVRAPR